MKIDTYSIMCIMNVVIHEIDVLLFRCCKIKFESTEFMNSMFI